MLFDILFLAWVCFMILCSFIWQKVDLLIIKVIILLEFSVKTKRSLVIKNTAKEALYHPSWINRADFYSIQLSFICNYCLSLIHNMVAAFKYDSVCAIIVVYTYSVFFLIHFNFFSRNWVYHLMKHWAWRSYLNVLWCLAEGLS